MASATFKCGVLRGQGFESSIERELQTNVRCFKHPVVARPPSKRLVRSQVQRLHHPKRQTTHVSPGGAHVCCGHQSSFLGGRSRVALTRVLKRQSYPTQRPGCVRASKGPIVPKPRVPIEVSNILTVLTTVFLVSSDPLFRSAGLTGTELHRTVISTQAIGLLVILALTVQSYLDLRALRQVTDGAARANIPEPSEAQAEVVDNSELQKELGRSQPSKDELKIFVTSGEGKKTRTLRLEEWSLDGARDYESLLDTVRKIVPQLAAYPLTVLYQVRQTGEFFLLEAEDDVQTLLSKAGFVYIHPSPSWE